MQITIDIPIVNECVIEDCAYNFDSNCHAKAITIGDGANPGCDTAFLHPPGHTNNRSTIAGVGACKVMDCAFNTEYECAADRIDVGRKGDDINCLTYQ